MAFGKEQMRRTEFIIHLDRKVRVLTLKGKHPSSDSALTFSSERELRKLAAQWPATRLVEIWNQLPGVKPVTRFTDRDTAIRRIWAVVQDLAPADGASAAASRDLGAKTERVLAADLTAAEFGRMNWVLHRLGPQAIVYPGQHQHTRAAIQSFSGPIRQERVLTHLGWRRQGTQYMYLHAGGALGTDGSLPPVQVELPPTLQLFEVKPPGRSE